MFNKEEGTHFGDAVQKLDFTKKRFLMLEYLGLGENLPKTYPTNNIKTMKNLLEACDEILKPLSNLPGVMKKFEDLEFEDYDVYTSEHHGRAFWNEIELHPVIEQLAKKMRSILNADFNETSTHSLILYDLSDFDLYFDTLEDLEGVISVEDVAPFTVYRMEPDGASPNIFHHYELYSA